MDQLIFVFLREKTKFILSLIVFSLIFTCFYFVIGNYSNSLYQIEKILNQEEHREITVLITNEEQMDYIQKIKQIEKIRENKITSKEIYLHILVDSEENVDEVMNTLKSFQLDPQLDKKASSELEIYLELKEFYQLLTIVLLITIVIVFMIEINLLLFWDRKNIIFLKILGYQNLMICGITLAKIDLLIIISNIIALLVFGVGNVFFHLSINSIVLLAPLLTVMVLHLLQFPILLWKVKKIGISNISDS